VKTSETRKKPKHELIVQAAAQVFAQKGFSGTVMAEIAVQAGVGKGTLYEYFDSKEDLFFAVFEWFSKQSSASATVSISALGGSASDRLEALSDSLMSSWVEMKDFFSLAMEFWAASASSQMRERFKEALRQCYEDFRRIVSTLIQDGMERGEFRSDVDPEATAAALVGAWDALFLQAWFDEAFDPQMMAKEFMTVLIRGLVSKKHSER
jgi:AcrR family transcriptional regulator